jgi:hypothetical protein
MAHLGVPLTEIQKILGHESLTTTEEYIQSLVGADRKAMEIFAQKLQELFHTNKKQPGTARPCYLRWKLWQERLQVVYRIRGFGKCYWTGEDRVRLILPFLSPQSRIAVCNPLFKA